MIAKDILEEIKPLGGTTKDALPVRLKPHNKMKNTILCAFIALLPASLVADERVIVEPRFVEIPQDNLRELSFDWLLGPDVPRGVAFGLVRQQHALSLRRNDFAATELCGKCRRDPEVTPTADTSAHRGVSWPNRRWQARELQGRGFRAASPRSRRRPFPASGHEGPTGRNIRRSRSDQRDSTRRPSARSA